MMKSSHFDLIIVGGGLAGSTLACALETIGIQVALVESVAIEASSQPAFDDRAIALAWGSRRIFDGIGLWDTIAPAATPIKQIHISEKGRFGQTHLDAAEEEVAALGYVVPARNIGHALQNSIQQRDIQRFCPATLVDFQCDNEKVTAHIETSAGTKVITASLLVAADGGRSKIRQSLGIKTRESHYEQTAIVSNILPGKPHSNIAYERFTTDGPLALLPMTDNRFGLVLTVPADALDTYLALDDAAFIDELHRRIGYRTGRFQQIGKRSSYPLIFMSAETTISQRCVLIGNAAHTLHPISGQGFNLGLRDIATLVDVIADARKNHADHGSEETLKRYAAWRKKDIRSITLATDGLARIFSHPLGSIGLARSAGLIATDLMPGVRHRIAKHAMGTLGHLPRLGRGASLD